jgi:hypothetical protein
VSLTLSQYLAELTDAGYSLSNGVYTQSFGSIVVNISVPQVSGVSGTLSVEFNGDASESDFADAQASLSSLGYPADQTNYALSPAGGMTYYGQTL